ncbi:MAG: amidohydrolase family protein [Desulfobacterales bacterium]|jgi:N-acetylglucosamine-6-phosphate deacetylase
MSILEGKISGGRIAELRINGDYIAGISIRKPKRRHQRLPGKEIFLAPGFLDIQVNGFAGIDINHPNFRGDDLVDVCRRLLSTGVTRFCDGPHLPDYFVKNVVRAKGKSRVVLITDATAASHAAAGQYTLGGLEIEAGDDGVLRLAGTPYLTGSTLTMDRAIGNCAKFSGITLASAIDMATVNPAGLFDSINGKLEVGQRADLVLFKVKGKKIRIQQVYLAGRLVHSAQDNA